MQAAEILQINQITKEYGDSENRTVAVNRVSFSVRKGEFVAVIGPSGCGKSTLLHMIGGVHDCFCGGGRVEYIPAPRLLLASGYPCRPHHGKLCFHQGKPDPDADGNAGVGHHRYRDGIF